MIARTPPVTVIRVPEKYGSFGYGAKIDGETICIPFNPSVVKILEQSGVTGVMSIMPRFEFNELQEYIPLFA